MDCVDSKEINGGGVFSESVDGGGRDDWSSAADHLVVMVNGILGRTLPDEAEQFVRILPDEVIVHCSERNVSQLTLDGVEALFAYS